MHSFRAGLPTFWFHSSLEKKYSFLNFFFFIIFFQHNIPKDSVKKYSNILHGNVNVWVSDGSNWPVEFCKRTYEDLKCRFNCRWKAFAKENNLEVGDVCAFELIEVTKTFKVVIFRVNEENCRAPYCLV